MSVTAPRPRKLGVAAGGGPLPLAVADAARAAGRDVFIVGVRGAAGPDIERYPHGWVRVGAMGRFLKLFKEAGCDDVVIIGPMNRPRLRDIVPDFRGLLLLPRFIGRLKSGDDALLRGVVEFLEENGLNVVGAETVLPRLLAVEGLLTSRAPNALQERDIDIAIAAARDIGARDIGQGAVVRDGTVVALEDEKGTDAMLRRVAAGRQDDAREREGVLVKLPKPAQERRVDLPTIGVRTVENAAAAGLAGIAVEAGGAIVSDAEDVARRADELGLFVVGFPHGRAVGHGAVSAGPHIPHVMLVAGEPSGDALGGELMEALKELTRGTVRITGAGGPDMIAQGLASIFPMSDTSVMGPREVIPRLPLILRRVRETADFAVRERPDVLVIIDSPDFTHMVARRVAGRAPDIPIANYVAPSVWAWRRGRARAMARYITRVLALLPFEPDFFRAEAKLDCVYVGHPAIERLPEPGSGARFRAVRGLSAEQPVLLLLPGSRANEVKRLIADFGATAALLARDFPDIKFVLPTVPHVRPLVEAAVKNWRVPVELVEGEAEKRAAFDAATAALAASGTVSLELGLARVPMVIAYKIDPVAAWFVSGLLKVPSVVTVNLILDRPSVREFLQAAVKPAALAEALRPLLTNTPERARALADLEDLRRTMDVGGDRPSLRAARAVLEMLAPHPSDRA